MPTLGAMVDVVTSSPATGEVCVGAGHRLQDDVVHFAHHRVGALQAGTRRQEDDDGLVADVLIRDEAGGHARHLEAGEADQADIEHAP